MRLHHVVIHFVQPAPKNRRQPVTFVVVKFVSESNSFLPNQCEPESHWGAGQQNEGPEFAPLLIRLLRIPAGKWFLQ